MAFSIGPVKMNVKDPLAVLKNVHAKTLSPLSPTHWNYLKSSDLA